MYFSVRAGSYNRRSVPGRTTTWDLPLGLAINSYVRFFAFLAITVWLWVVLSAAQSQRKFDGEAEARIYAELNQSRADAGLPPLKLDAKLTEVARQHSILLSQHHKLSHQFPGEAELEARLRAAGLHSTKGGENAGMNSDAGNVNEAFLESPGHRANMLSRTFNAVGIGVVQSGSLYWVTEDFATESPLVSVEEAENEVAAAFEARWKRAGAVPLKRVTVPRLQALACETATRGRLQTGLVEYDSRRARRLISFTTPTPSTLPPEANVALAAADFHAYAVAACMPQADSENGVIWILVAFF